MLQGMRVLVAGKHYIRVLEELQADHVAQRVVLLIDGVDGSIGNLGIQGTTIIN